MDDATKGLLGELGPGQIPEDFETPTQALSYSGEEATVAGGSSGSLRVPLDQGSGDLEPKAKLGRFEIVSLLGEGAMGKVYKAFDPGLNRHVALKLLRGEDPELVERFFHEARAQGSLDHPHICRVYEVGTLGTSEGRLKPYIVMQLIQGPTLRQAAPEMSIEQKLRAIREAAEGLHEAHRQGIIHRDVKPGNLLVERTEQGGWKTYVLDFGLAKGQTAAGLTQTGVLMGTPYYMSPEQARGESHLLDRRSDVYSLGASLFELLTGQPPFKGSSGADVLVHVLHDEPPSLRSIMPRLPVDLGIIVGRCLDKDPNRRYDSARALAEDLERFLNGEPIQARAESWPSRLKRWIRRNRLAAAGLGAAILLFFLLVGLGIHAQFITFRVAKASGKLGHAVQEMDSIMHYAYLLPPHDVNRERKAVKKRLERLEDLLRELRGGPRGLAHYIRGRAFLALRDYESARKELETAWNFHYRDPEVALALGMSLGELYREKQATMRQMGVPGKEAEKALDRNYCQPANDLLSGLTGDAASSYIKAWLAFFKKDYDRALALARDCQTQEPWRYDAKRLEGEILFLRLLTEGGQQDPATQNAWKRACEESFQEASILARSDPAPLEGLLLFRMFQMETSTERGSTRLDLAREIQESCRQLLLLDPSRAMAPLALAYVKARQVESQPKGSPQVQVLLDEARVLARQATELEAGNPKTWLIFSLVNMEQGHHQRHKGQDPRDAFRQAIQASEKTKSLDDLGGFWSRIALSNAAGSASEMASYELAHGLEAHSSLAQAETFFREGLALDPSYLALWANRGEYQWNKAKQAQVRGEDPLPHYQQAMKDFTEAGKLGYAFAPLFEIRTLLYQAQFLIMKSQSASQELQEIAKRLSRLDPQLDPPSQKKLRQDYSQLQARRGLP